MSGGIPDPRLGIRGATRTAAGRSMSVPTPATVGTRWVELEQTGTTLREAASKRSDEAAGAVDPDLHAWRRRIKPPYGCGECALLSQVDELVQRQRQLAGSSRLSRRSSS
jgi:hypothetical protein